MRDLCFSELVVSLFVNLHQTFRGLFALSLLPQGFFRAIDIAALAGEAEGKGTGLGKIFAGRKFFY